MLVNNQATASPYLRTSVSKWRGHASGFCCDARGAESFLRVFALFNVSLAIAVCLFPALPASRPACTPQLSCIAMKASSTHGLCCQVLPNFVLSDKFI